MLLARNGLGSTASDVAQSVINVALDPCLGDVARLLNQLHQLEQKPVLPGVTPPPSVPVKPELGIGLCKAVKPLQAVIWARQNPWIFAASAFAIVGTLIGVGYSIGSRRRSAP